MGSRTAHTAVAGGGSAEAAAARAGAGAADDEEGTGNGDDGMAYCRRLSAKPASVLKPTAERTCSSHRVEAADNPHFECTALSEQPIRDSKRCRARNGVILRPVPYCEWIASACVRAELQTPVTADHVGEKKKRTDNPELLLSTPSLSFRGPPPGSPGRRSPSDFFRPFFPITCPSWPRPPSPASSSLPRLPPRPWSRRQTCPVPPRKVASGLPSPADRAGGS